MYKRQEKQTAEVLKLMLDEYSEICKKGITSDELVRSKNQMKTGYLLGRENTSAHSSAIGRTELMGTDYLSEEEIIRIAIKSMGLDELKPFKPEEKVIEYLIEADNKKKKLVDLTCTGFAEETASESPAPGGGSISAYMGALGAALGTMVANLSSHKPGWDARWEEFSDWADKGQKLMTELLHLVDEDTEAFNRIMNVFSMPKGTDEEKAARSAALQEATLYATQVPLRTMQTSFKVFEIVKAMAEQGNPNSVTDAGVGALAARSAVLGACLNVKINAAGLKDRAVADDLIGQANRIVADAEKAEREILEIVESKIK